MLINEARVQPLVCQQCRSQHRAWAAQLRQSEGDIDLLLILLASLPITSITNPAGYVTTYTQTLEQLKARVQALQNEVICQVERCPPTVFAGGTCPDPHFVPANADQPLISSATTDIGQLEGRCATFLGELVQLNLI